MSNDSVPYIARFPMFLQVTVEGRTVEFSTSSALSDPVFEARINGNNVLLQVRVSNFVCFTWNKLMHWLTDWLTDSQPDRQTDRQTDRSKSESKTNNQLDSQRLSDRKINKQTNEQSDRQIYRHLDSQTYSEAKRDTYGMWLKRQNVPSPAHACSG